MTAQVWFLTGSQGLYGEETLQQVAHRVAPDAPVGHVVDRIRELNQLESTSLDAGQTLIAPVG